MKEKRLTHKVMVFELVLLFFLTAMLTVFAVSSISVVRDEVQKESEDRLDMLDALLNDRFSQIHTIVYHVLSRNSQELEDLQNSSESVRSHALQVLYNELSTYAVISGGYSAMVLFDSTYQVSLMSVPAALSYDEKQAVLAYVLHDAAGDSQPGWKLRILGGRAFLLRSYCWKSRVITALLLADDLLSSFEGKQTDRTFYIAAPSDPGSGMTVVSAAGRYDGDPRQSHGFVAERETEAYVLFCEAGSRAIRAGTMNVLILEAAVILLTLLSALYLGRLLNRAVVRPLSAMTKTMERIEDGELELRLQDKQNAYEFSKLTGTFNTLMDELLRMRILTYEKQIELRDLELQSMHLQLRPHFFLNAMTTISSLSREGKDKEIQTYIEALSKNIRYMFKSGLSTVPVSEEMEHVADYFAMQECRYPGCIFYYIDMESGAGNWEIPRMLVQTFVENAYKHAMSPDTLLTILIGVRMEEWRGERVLEIRIEDDGPGYPEHVLQEMRNRQNPTDASQGSHVGLRSIRRILELMYERDDLLELCNRKPHGCVSVIRLPEKPVRQKENVKTTGD